MASRNPFHFCRLPSSCLLTDTLSPGASAWWCHSNTDRHKHWGQAQSRWLRRHTKLPLLPVRLPGHGRTHLHDRGTGLCACLLLSWPAVTAACIPAIERLMHDFQLLQQGAVRPLALHSPSPVHRPLSTANMSPSRQH